MIGLAVRVQHEVTRSPEKVVPETQSSAIVPQILNVHALDHRRFIITRAEPRKACFGGEGTRYVALGVIEKIAECDLEPGPGTVPLHRTVHVAQIAIELGNTGADADLQVALCEGAKACNEQKGE